MNLERMSLDQLRKLLVKIERQLTEDELFMESVMEGTRHEPSWQVGAVRARLENKQEEKREVQASIENTLQRSMGG